MARSDELDQLLKNLHLRKILDLLDEELERAQKRDVSYQELLLRLFRAQWHHRQERSLECRIKRAKLPCTWTLESFPFKRQTGVSARQIRSLAGLEFVAKAENVVFVGPTGVGKTGLATGLVLKALQNGQRAIFVKAQDLFDEMYSSLADRSTRKLVNQLAKIDLLCIDELGYLTIKAEQANIFFKLMEERYTRRSTIITTNMPYDDWHSLLGNRSMTEALLSRLRHHCHTIKIDGPSLRDPQG
jgi:DNA replication protein DnaC